jgi:hypothetical protein
MTPQCPRDRSDDHGFGIVELLISTTLLLVVIATAFKVLNPAEGAFRVEPEATDVQQRLRVATDAIADALDAAGAGPTQGYQVEPLIDLLAPVLPFSPGQEKPRSRRRVQADVVTIVSAARGAAQSTIAQALPAASGPVQVNVDPGCPQGDPLCGFRAGMDVMVFDDTGAYDTFTIATVQGTVLNLQHNLLDTPRVYPANTSRILEVENKTHFLRTDVANSMLQLARYDGAAGADVPVVDHLAALTFAYFGDPQPPTMLKPQLDPVGPWTTYGPKPPASGDNCIFAAGVPLPISRLPVLGSGVPGLVPLGATDLTDGPWCPSDTDPNRFDADLLRVRAILVTVRAEASSTSLRGPAGRLFTRGGTATGQRFVPDREVSFTIAPRNVNLRR